MKRTVRVNLSRITRRKGLLNLTLGGRGKSPDLHVTSFTVAPAASVPFSCTFNMALWTTCKEQSKTTSSWQSSKQRTACHPLHFVQPKGALPGARPSSSCFWEGHHQSLPFPPQHQQPSHHSSHPPSLLMQRVTLKLQAAKEHSRWLMTRNSGSKETW